MIAISGFDEYLEMWVKFKRTFDQRGFSLDQLLCGSSNADAAKSSTGFGA